MTPRQADSSIIAFLDTNTLVHCKYYDQLDWPLLLSTKNVRLIVVLQVIDELDSLKFSSPIKAIRSRATDLTKRLAEIGLLNRQGLANGATIELFAPPSDGAQSAQNGDDLLLTQVSQFGLDPGEKRVLVSFDAGLRLRAGLRSINTIELPPTTLEPRELDRDALRLRELESELRLLKSRIPDLRLRFADGAKLASLVRVPTAQKSAEEIERRLAAVLTHVPPPFPLSPGPVLIGPAALLASVGDAERARYRKDYEAFLVEYRAFIGKLIDAENRESRTFCLTLILTNCGTAPAENIEIRIIAPEMTAFLPADTKEKKLDPPPFPPFPKTALERTLASSILGGLGDRDFPRAPDMSFLAARVTPETSNTEGPFVKYSRGREARFTTKRLRHNGEEQLDTATLRFDSADCMRNCTLAFEIHCDTLPHPVKETLHLVFTSP